MPSRLKPVEGNDTTSVKNWRDMGGKYAYILLVC